MAVTRELLAAVLGIALGAVFVAFPSVIVRVHTVGRGPHDHHGEFGTHEIDAKWLWLVRAIGAVGILFGIYFGYTALLA